MTVQGILCRITHRFTRLKLSQISSEKHAISVIEWPPHSPDLNPIENVWHLLKLSVQRQYPDLSDLLKNEVDIAKFKEVVTLAWEGLDQRVIDSIVGTMPRRLKGLRKAGGSYLKY